MDQQYEVVGFRKYEGEYEGHKYSGYFVHCITESNRPNFEGKECAEIKVKSKLNYLPCVGDVIIPRYNQFGLCAIDVWNR